MDLLTRRDELAAVIAHEMAHVLARHSAEAMTAALVTLPLRVGAALALESGSGVFDAMHNVLVALRPAARLRARPDTIGMQLRRAPPATSPPHDQHALQAGEHGGADACGEEAGVHADAPADVERIEAARRQIPQAQQIMDVSECNAFSVRV
eukprot:jgi/Ulvmu1/11789/UM008_0204.1